MTNYTKNTILYPFFFVDSIYKLQLNQLIIFKIIEIPCLDIFIFAIVYIELCD